MIGLIQIEQAIANAILLAKDLQIYGPETEGERMLAQALQGIFSDLDRAMQAHHGDPFSPERRKRLVAAIRGTYAAWFIALSKDNPSEPLADRILELRSQIVHARRV